MKKAGLMSDLDRVALTAMCDQWGIYVQAMQEVNRRGLVVKTKAGGVQENQFLWVANRALEKMHKLLVEFALTPSSRSRVTGSNEQDPEEQKKEKEFFDSKKKPGGQGGWMQ